MSESVDLNVRGIDVEYGPVISQQVRKKLDEETVLLKSVTVTVKHERRKNGEMYNDYYDVVFRARHDRDVLEAQRIEDSHGDLETLAFDKMHRVARTAENAAESYLDCIDHDYEVGWIDVAFGDGTKGVAVDVFNDQDEI